ncbi:hypothetical protein U3A55_07660 [Salarchaeum sp. III]|uniref:hypothetical protein n=1 Tax=Salarchaeum sp. III TaxID=3107927 RepID=UPI002EDB96DC
MSTVSVREGVRYGFSLLWYLVGVWLVGGLVAFAGITITGGTMGLAMDGMSRGYAAEPNTAAMFAGGALVLVGGAIVYAGSLGILYKIIADAVKRGNEVA